MEKKFSKYTTETNKAEQKIAVRFTDEHYLFIVGIINRKPEFTWQEIIDNILTSVRIYGGVDLKEKDEILHAKKQRKANSLVMSKYRNISVRHLTLSEVNYEWIMKNIQSEAHLTKGGFINACVEFFIKIQANKING